jgi:hypothetical protein
MKNPQLFVTTTPDRWQYLRLDYLDNVLLVPRRFTDYFDKNVVNLYNRGGHDRIGLLVKNVNFETLV